ncbi:MULTISPECIES: class I SAM-dependent methyltransferase [unclassified Streptomyces]|uniref:class I SAM-dependent methyltransferase n=1 Tax=unclassified Streptomyces TaxID=2593676 RepID=UPI001F04BD40|nr:MULTISPECIES: class I SAM-dependent methyltransferase [unclassified Streptomyces]MCH0566866.1 class I SAM-dependent methyltransferase [Streptomyces sp. MUM 2J]MCH0569837.1 class I SAM-dependent methyltransferase [Streptomyces sp. MUM 136J]
MRVPEGARVLGIGCGRGALLFPLAEATGPRGSAVGIDFAEPMVEAAAREAEARDLDHVTVHHVDGEAPDFGPGSFDIITGSMSIVMLPDPPAAFADYSRLLAPGGCLGVTAPDTRTGLGAWQMGHLDIGRVAE